MDQEQKNSRPSPVATTERLTEKSRPQETATGPELGFPPLPGIGIDLLTLGRFLVQSGYFTDVKSLSQAAVKVLLGQELGVPPITAMMNVYLVNGRPAM